MKTFTANFEAEKNRKTGAAPIWILKIAFSAGTLYLADQVVTITGWSSPDPVTKAWVQNWGTVDEDIADSLAAPQVSDFSVDLIVDPDEATDIGDLLWSEAVETIDCELYLWFSGLDASIDPPVLFWSGNIIDFDKVNELIYNVTLADESVRIDKHPGRVLSLADYGDAYLNDVGYQMTIVYGTVEKAPALRLDVGQTTSLAEAITATQTAFNLSDATGITATSTIVVDAEEITITGLTGDRVTSCVRGANSNWTDGVLTAMNQGVHSWSHMAAAPNGDVYVTSPVGYIFKQTAGVGNFINLAQAGRAWTGIAAAPNGDVYSCVNGGDIYKQTAGAGDFNALTQTSRAWSGMAAAPNGNIYCCVRSTEDIYMQTGGTGDFATLNQTHRDWRGMAAAPNGNIYACVYGGDIYMQTGGTGDFVALGGTNRNWIAMAADPDGNVYACANGVGIFKQTGGSGAFVAINSLPVAWSGLAAAYNGDIYAAVATVDIYKAAGTATVHSIGTVIREKTTASVFLYADHPVGSIDKVYALGLDGIPIDVTSLCATYTGQSGQSPSQELTGYEGMAVVTCPLSDYVTDSRLLISGTGYIDDGSGTYTGTPGALIEQPDHVVKHFLYTYASWPLADFSTDAAASLAAAGYKFSIVMHERMKIKAWLAKMAFECRCWFRFSCGKAYLLWRPDSLSSDRTITAGMIRANDDGTTTLKGPTRTPLDEIINVVHLYYKRDWLLSGRDAYQGKTRALDAASIAAYGEKEQEDRFLFDLVRDDTMATSLRDFYLARYKDRKKKVVMDLFLDNSDLEFADGIAVTPVGGSTSPVPVFEIRKSNAAPGSGAPLRMDTIVIHAREY